MKNLVIVESPSKSKTIEKYLGKDYQVVSSKGHIRDLATSGKGGLGVDVDNNFKPTYIVNYDKKDVVKDLKEKCKKADKVYLSTDPDREGEAIAWHLAQELGLDLNDDNRVVFNEITKDAVINAFKTPHKVDMSLVKSQETRRIIDRIIGFKLSTLLQSRIKSQSAGRVQSVALKLICDREKEIAAFKPDEYWTVHANFEKDKKLVESSLVSVKGKKPKIENEEAAKNIIDSLHDEFTVKSIEEKITQRKAYLPFTTSTLQQTSINNLGYSAKRTMSIAQRLYEGVSIDGELQGLITYMRTDSTRLSPVFVNEAKALIEKKYGKEYVGYYREKNDANAQDAHEAIRPTSLANDPEKIKDYLTVEQNRLYSLIYNRALASLMSNSKTNTEIITFENNDCDFEARGSRLVFDGYRKAYDDDSDKDRQLPKFEKGEKVKANEKPYGKQHFTEPPLRYSEARLIKDLEDFGIGRPSTYAMILDTIVQRDYVELVKSTESSKTKVFVPTEQGNLTDTKLAEFFESIINVDYTASMESDLDKIAEDKKDYLTVLNDFYNAFMPVLENASKNMEKLQPEKTGEKCPECGGDLVIRKGKYGKFVSCSNYPKCSYKESLEEDKPELLDLVCPECGSQLLKRKNKYGSYFIGCSNYPKCHYIKPDENAPRKGRFYRKRTKNES